MKSKIFCFVFFFYITYCINAQYSWEKLIQEENGKKRLIIHGEKGKLYDKINYVRFSQDGTRVAYTVKLNGRLLMVTDTIETEYQNVEEKTITFSATGKRLVFAAKKDNKWFVIVDGKPETQVDNFEHFRSLQFSPDEKRISYIACKDMEYWVVVDGKEDGKKYDDIVCNRFSPDNQRTVYAGRKFLKWVMVVDGVEDKIKMDGVMDFTPVFSRNSKHLVYGGNIWNDWFMVIDGRQSIIFEGIGKGSPVFSTTGDSVGYMAIIKKRWTLVINNEIIEEFVFSCDLDALWSLKIIEEYFSIKPENRCPLIVNNFESSSGLLIKVNAYNIPYPVNIVYDHTHKSNQSKLESGMNVIGIDFKTSLFTPYQNIYYDLKSTYMYKPPEYNSMNFKFYFNAYPGKVYTIKTGPSASDFLTCIYMGENYIGIVDITESYLRE